MLEPGSKIKFLEERFNYTVRAAGKRFAVCTRPHFKIAMYTVLDLVDQVRSTENSRRNMIPLNIAGIKQIPVKGETH